DHQRPAVGEEPQALLPKLFRQAWAADLATVHGGFDVGHIRDTCVGEAALLAGRVQPGLLLSLFAEYFRHCKLLALSLPNMVASRRGTVLSDVAVSGFHSGCKTAAEILCSWFGSVASGPA